jgi:hypothetical protein
MMNNGHDGIRERLAALRADGDEPRPRRSAESIAREAYHSSQIEGCRVEYPGLVEAAKAMRACADRS